MIYNYLKIAFRTLFKEKLYSFINIFGLAIGVACCILIGLYVFNEWNYDKFHTNSDRTYRVWYEETLPDQRVIENAATPVILGPTLRDNIPEIEHITYLFTFNNTVTTDQQPNAQSESFLVVNDDFLEIFDFELLRGNPATVFSNPSSVIISESTAKRLFGDKDPLQQGLTIRMGDEYMDFIVAGVIEDTPVNSSISYNILLPYQNLDYLISERGQQSWFNIYGSTYVTLQEGTDPAELSAKFESMMETVLGSEVFNETQYTLYLQPLTDIHLDTELVGPIASVSDPVYSYILSAIALLILLIACVNFMTISISRSASRAKEVGIRKTIGAIRQHLMYQFWGEALLMTVIAFFIGLMLAEILLPFFNNLSGTDLNLVYTSGMLISLIVTAIVVSLLAGIYPAFILSGFRPVEVLKGKINVSGGKGRFQQFMVVTQFALSILLIIGTITIRQQMNYVQNKNLGYQKDQVLVLETGIANTPQNDPDEVFQNALRYKQLFLNQIGALSDINSITVASLSPIQTGGWFRLSFTDNEEQIRNFHGNVIDADFIPALGINVLEGRNFSDENTSDQRRAIIVNEALVDYFGWENPIGESLPGPEFVDHEVIGVVENFHFESLHTSIEPLAFSMSFEILFSGIQNLGISSSFDPRIAFNLTTDNLQETVSEIEENFRLIAPGAPFNYSFVDQALDNQYRQEQRLSRIAGTGSVLAIIIACLGLFGLASLMVIRRTKEIGVRKVLGASSKSIVFLINKEFSKLVAISFVIASPIAWYGMNNWLQDFAYRIELGVGIFLLAGLITLAVAWLTVSYQSIKATLINPTESLKSD